MSKLFEPIAVGAAKLNHRIAMAPLTRYRMDDDWKATALSKGKLAEAANMRLFCRKTDL
jgi:NADPH2 dehydrogenase